VDSFWLGSRRLERSPIRKSYVLVHCSTESRAALVACTYLMFANRMTPAQAFGELEKALPLFNATRTFLAQLELFYSCDCAPTMTDPRVHEWLEGNPTGRRSSQTLHATGHCSKNCSGAESECESEMLRRKIHTPARCDSFATPSPGSRPSFSALSRAVGVHRNNNNNSNLPEVVPSATSAAAAERHKRSCTGNEGGADVDVDALLRRVAGVGSPDFAFDTEAFRGTLRGLGLRDRS